MLLSRGRLRVESRGREVGVLRPGAWLGEASLVRVGEREATATAAKTSIVLRLERSSMRVMIDEAPLTAARVFEALAASLADTLQRYVDDATVDPEAADA